MAEILNKELINKVAEGLNVRTEQVEAALGLLAEGATIPFIARYRKEVTGSLDEEQIRAISKEYEYKVSLNKRKDDIIRLIDEKGMLTEELKAEILAADKLITLEDIYRPYKEKKKTKATEAIKNGLEPLANWIKTFPMEGDVWKEAKKYINENVPTDEAALEGAKYIIAEQISDTKEYRELIRENILQYGSINTEKKKNAVDEAQKYRDYYEHREQIKYLKSHKILAINRAEDEKILNVTVDCNRDYYCVFLKKKEVSRKNEMSITAFLVQEACEDAFDRLMFPSIEREVRSILTEQAEDQAIKLFGQNLEHVLLSAPLKEKNVLGVDPAFRTGCKVVALDKTGKVLEKDKIFQNQMYPGENVPEKRIVEAKRIVYRMCKAHNIDVIAIGNGTASRETERFIAETVKEYSLPCKYIIVSEAGASVYSASKLAIEEFPDYHVEERSAVSIGRRIQDPLAELIKIDPKSIGVGQYQHDVDQAKLSDQLDFVVEKAVNSVGVNANTASRSLLQYVSGLNKASAQAFVDYREENGEFHSRAEIKKVPKIGPKAFEQCAGFLRVPTSKNAFDRTPIHPEQYENAEKVLVALGFTKDDLGSSEIVEKVNSTNQRELSESLEINPITLADILLALTKPSLDPRDELPQPELKSELLSLEDLKPGMKLEGTVRNITDFGAFIDLGVHESGLLHISKMSKRRINHPSEVMKVGDILTVYVLDVDLDRKRLSLSLFAPNQTNSK